MYKTLSILFLLTFNIILHASNLVYNPAAQAKSSSPVVLELFTSQGCSSCPPAEALLNELADRDDVIPLALHVTYWDHIGWKDPYGHPNNSLRQRHYSGVLSKRGTGQVYTPQIVINGQYETVGSKWMKINSLTKAARKKPAFANIAFEPSPDGNILLRITNNGYAMPPTPIDIWLFTILDTTKDRITRGENRGKTLISRNIVSNTMKIGTWDRGNATLLLDKAKLRSQGDAIAIVLQGRGLGRIVGAGRYKFK